MRTQLPWNMGLRLLQLIEYFHELLSDMSDKYMRLISSERSSLRNVEKYVKITFFQAGMAGLGKYCIGRYDQIGVYRVKCQYPSSDNVTYACIRPRVGSNCCNVVCYFRPCDWQYV